ncbi:alpha/beta hydrolase [Meridianimarinicoccus aquatilis]|uniref:Alpha/beta hydrolase n=1 Tax=Meridianimarinicoccus aquatilis TaxID=2552766 RepID=A0A4R6B4D2_9RHOB|nr:alpha/beta hydrolase [Fluviibacterium aquatile]QIE42350.1 alpha/beta hydrolase [Rhodobacteraceae bacterium SC52]TDL91254.1 alpha/beta hydrolase [Fluviibacterium aquatile]
MTYAAAPFHHTSAGADQAADAVWAYASDGVRLRLVEYSRGDAGTILMVPGRTEYLEKYGHIAQAFAHHGYGMVSLDIRGQGLADRLVTDPMIGHVNDFADYQRDIDTLVAFAKARKMPRPWFVIGHSLGGAIGLRTVMSGLEVQGAVFSAPMWGIAMPAVLRPVSWSLGWMAHRNELNSWLTPGMSRESYVQTCDLEDNLLTSDKPTLLQMRAQILAQPGVGLGGPSMPWLYRALRECEVLKRIPNTPVSTLTFLPEREEIVCSKSIRALTDRWDNATLIEVPGGRHETMMETPDRQRLFIERCVGFFQTSGRAMAAAQ